METSLPVFSHLSGCFFISHRSFSSLNFLFELKNHLRNPAKSGQRKSLNNFYIIYKTNKLRRPLYLSLSVTKVRAASSSPTIQKRTTILDSGMGACGKLIRLFTDASPAFWK